MSSHWCGCVCVCISSCGGISHRCLLEVPLSCLICGGVSLLSCNWWVFLQTVRQREQILRLILENESVGFYGYPSHATPKLVTWPQSDQLLIMSTGGHFGWPGGNRQGDRRLFRKWPQRDVPWCRTAVCAWLCPHAGLTHWQVGPAHCRNYLFFFFFVSCFAFHLPVCFIQCLRGLYPSHPSVGFEQIHQ